MLGDVVMLITDKYLTDDKEERCRDLEQQDGILIMML